MILICIPVFRVEGQADTISKFEETSLSHRPKQGANYAWSQQSGAWGELEKQICLG